MQFPLVILLCLALVQSRNSYFDTCYRYSLNSTVWLMSDYQIYMNRKGEPVSRDVVFYFSDMHSSDPHLSFYFKTKATKCDRTAEGFYCDFLIQSIWFQIHNTTAVPVYAAACDKAFIGKYGDIMKHDCKMENDPISGYREDIGKTEADTIYMKGKVPLPPDGYIDSPYKCVIDYNVLGLLSIATLVIIGVAAVVVLIVAVILIIYVQKNRSNKRKALDSSLLNKNAPAV